MKATAYARVEGHADARGNGKNGSYQLEFNAFINFK